MFCAKCNSEIPEGARFCVTCGEPVKRKKLCVKCQSELLENTKFCTVCGTRVEGEAAPEMSSVHSMAAAESVKPAVEAMAAVEPIKPAVEEIAAVEPVKTTVEKIAEAETTAAEKFNEDDGFEIPVIAPVISEEPDNGVFGGFEANSPFSLDNSSEKTDNRLEGGAGISVPQPAYSAASAFSKPASSTEKPSDTVFGGGYIPPYNPSKASENAQTPTVVSNAPVAAVKKNAKKPVIIAIVAVLVAAIIGGVIFYITNTAVILSTFMGKANYAAMVEGNSLKQAATLLDRNSLSSGIKNASGVYASVSSITTDKNGNLIAKLSNTANDTDVVDLTSLFAAIYGSIEDTYGVNSVTFTVGMNAELTDTAREQLKNNLHVTDEQINDMLDYMNNSKLSAGITAGESAAAFKAGAEIKSLKVDLKLLVNSKGEAYVVLPFASEKAILFKVGEIAEDEIEFTSSGNVVALEFDEKEIERILNEIVELYIECYKSAEVEMENGELSVSGVSVSGKVLTAEFDRDMLKKLISDIGEKLAKDEYFKGKIVEYFNDCGIEMSKSEYEETILDAFSELTLDRSAKLKATTVITNTGAVLGKSYQLSANGGKIKLSYAEANNEFAIELKSDADGETSSVTVKTVSESSTAGTTTVKIAGDGTNVTLKIKYKDAKTEKFCGKDIATGTYEVSVSLPKNFEEENGSYANYTEFLADTKLVLSTSVNGSTCTSSIGLKSDKFGEVSFTCALTAENNNSDLNTPSSVIDCSPYMDGSEPDDAFKEELIEYLESVRDAISKQNAGELGDSAADAIDNIISSSNQVSADKVNELSSAILTGRNEVLGFSSKYGISDFYGESIALYQRYNDLYLDFTSVYYENYALTGEEYADFKSRLEELDNYKKELEAEYRAAAGLDEGYNFDSMEADDVMRMLAEFKNKLDEIMTDEDVAAQIESSPSLKSKYDECASAYDSAFNIALEAYKEYVANGTVNEELLSSAQSSLETFVNTFTELCEDLDL